jgi:hypothetical protein
MATSLDKLMANMCTDKVSKETGMDLRNSALQFDPDINLIRKYNQSLPAVWGRLRMHAIRTVQATIFEVFAGHEIGGELKAISQ